MGKRGRPVDSSAIDGEALPSDITEDALTRSSFGRAGSAWYPDGAEDLPSILLVLRDLCDAIFEIATCRPDIMRGIRSVCLHGLVVTSCFTGTGAFEIACSMVYDRLCELCGINPCLFGHGLVCYSACDSNAVVQRFLQRHPQSSRCQHLFSDVLDRLPGHDRDTCEGIVDDHMRKETLWKHFSEDGLVTSNGLSQKRSALGQSLVRELTAILEVCEFEEKAWCIICKKDCFVSPRAHCDAYSNSFWLEAAGTICCPFSHVNQAHTKWLDKSTLSCLVWVYSFRYYQPDAGIHECVVPFTESQLGDILGYNSKASGSEAMPPKCPFARFDATGCSAPHFSLRTRVHSPVSFGVPSNRSRKYTDLDLAGVVEVLPNINFEQVFFRKLRASPCIYKVVGSEVYQQSLALMRSKHNAGARVDETTMLTSESALTSALYEKYQGYLDMACRDGLVVDCGDLVTWKPKAAIVNLKQVAGKFGHIQTSSVPALLRGSVLIDLVDGRLLLPAEHWFIQGFPCHFDGLPPTLHKYFPPSLVDGLSAGEVRSLTGNAMHVVQIGATVLFKIACTSKSFYSEV